MGKVWVMFQVAAGLSGWVALGHAAELAKPDAGRGQAVVAQVCAACHGADGPAAT